MTAAVAALVGGYKAAAPGASYNALVAAQSPSLWWKCDDASGATLVADASGHANTGSLGGSTTLYGWHAASLVTGQNFGLTLGDRLSSASTVSAMTAAYTQKIWFKGNGNAALFGLGNDPGYNTSGGYGAYLILTSGNKLQAGIYVPSVGSVVTATGTTTIDTARHCAALEIDPAAQTMKIYLDGALEASVSLGGTPDAFAAYAHVGFAAQTSVAPIYAGEVQSYEFFPSVLGATEEAAEWNAGR